MNPSLLALTISTQPKLYQENPPRDQLQVRRQIAESDAALLTKRLMDLGFILVPIEPTPAMVQAGIEATKDLNHNNPHVAYAVMCAKAQEHT